MPFATANLPGLITTSCILPHSIWMAIACCLHIIMNGCPLVLPFHHCTHAPVCHHLSLVSPEYSDDGEEESRGLDRSEHFFQEPHYIHNEMPDVSPGFCLNDIHYLEDDVSTISDTKEFFEEQNEKENVVARSKIKLLSPTEEVLQAWKHCNITLWSPLQHIMQTPIHSNQYLLPVAQLVQYTPMHSQCGTGLHELIPQNLQHKEIFHLLCLTVLQCLNSMEDNTYNLD
jgi:hypothetical protein